MTGGRDGSGCMEELPWGGAREGKQQHPEQRLKSVRVRAEWRATTGHLEK